MKTDMFESNTPLAREFMATEEIPFPYPDRLKAIFVGPAANLLRMMGVEDQGVGITVLAANVKNRLGQEGIESDFDSYLTPAGIVDPDAYLALMEDGKFPVAFDTRGHLLHDFVFHGMGFIGLNPDLGQLVKRLGSKRAAFSAKDTSFAVNTIDALTGTYSGLATGRAVRDEVVPDLADRIRELHDLDSRSTEGLSMFEASQIARHPFSPEEALVEAEQAIEHFESLMAHAQSLTPPSH